MNGGEFRKLNKQTFGERITGYTAALEDMCLFKDGDTVCYWLALIDRAEDNPALGCSLIAEMDNPPAGGTQAAEIEALRAEVEVWKASFEQAAAGHATYAERTEQLAKVLRLTEEHINAITPDWYNAGQQVLAAIRDALSKEKDND